MKCSGTESRLIDCQNIGIGNHNCVHSEDAGVTCLSSVTPTGSGSGGGPDVRVCFSDREVNSGPFNYSYDGSLTSFEGPVEICVNGQYESVCDIGWDKVDAQALCRYQLGGNVGKLLLV